MDRKIDVNEMKEVLSRYIAEAEKMLKDNEKVTAFLKLVESKFKTMENVAVALQDVPLLISLVKDFVSGKYPNIPIGSIATIIGALLYLLNTVDLIPDVIPVVGFIADAAVLALAVSMVKIDVEKYKQWKENNQSAE